MGQKYVLEAWWYNSNIILYFFLYLVSIKQYLEIGRQETQAQGIFFFIFLLLFICAYKAWFISPPCPHPLPYHPLHPLPLPALNTQQKLFCPYL
jgi:hypothetical protein